MRWLPCLFLALTFMSSQTKADTLCQQRLLAEALPAGISQTNTWRRLFDKDDICIWSRSRYSDQIKEIAAVATIDATPDQLAQLILACDQISRVFRDVDRCQTLRSTSEAVWIFQQIRLPWPARDRFFSARLQRRSSGNGVQEVVWSLAPQDTRANPGSGVAVAHNSGRWRFRQIGSETSETIALYYLAVDPGGSSALPNWIIDFGHRTAIPNMIRDMRKAF